MAKELTPQRQKFVEEYLQCWNGSEAARRAGYKWPGKQAWALLQRDVIKDAIAERIAARAMGADEVLARLAAQARGDIADFIRLDVPGGMPDLERAKERGLTHLIKKIRWTGRGVEIELYDSQSALVHLGRHLGLFKDRIEIDWREQARQDGVDPEQIEDELVEQFIAAMVSSGDGRSVPDGPEDSQREEQD